ncbi:hypothetical protein ASC64_19150 [Nocardioides sp. Root122]|nr:hypothetical protein ASC64_19150 [Nocardioides sp. Root122]
MWLSGALVLVAAAVCVLGAIRIGVTVDETFHVVRLQNFFDHGWYLLDDDLSAGAVGSWVGDAYVYAPVTTLFLHGANVVLGNETWGTVATSSDAYLVRHLGVVLIGAVGVAATAATAARISGSWRWALVAAGMLSAMPMWWGHAMFNVKDIPVGTGYALVTLGCMLALGAPSVATDAFRGRHGRLSAVAVAAGVLLTIGTRPAMWVALGTVLAWTALAMVMTGAPDSAIPKWRRVAMLVASALAPLALLAAIYPSVFARPDLWLWESVFDSSSNGMVSSRGHLPFAVAGTVPIVLLVVGLLGSYGRFAAWRSDPRLFSGRAPLMVLLLLQALLLPVLLVASGAPLSGGLRHVLFAAPAVAVLMAAGLAQLFDDAGARGRQAVAAIAGVGMVLPVVTSVQLFPYSYGYVNEVAAALGVNSQADFWQASFREYADKLDAGDFVVCGATTDEEGRPLRQMPNGGQSWLDLSLPCTGQKLGVLAPYAQDLPASEVKAEFVALRVRLEPPSKGCREIARVTRPRLFDTVVLSTAEACPLVLIPYGGPITLDGAGRGAGYLLGGWSGNPGDPTISVEDRASLGFELQDGLDELRVLGDATGSVEFLINNRPAVSLRTGTGWLVSPGGVIEELGSSRNVVLTIVARGGDAEVSGVEVVGADS